MGSDTSGADTWASDTGSTDECAPVAAGAGAGLGVVIADLDGDARDDLAAADASTGAWVCAASGGSVALPESTSAMLAGDIDGDGVHDLLWDDRYGGVEVVLGPTGGVGHGWKTGAGRDPCSAGYPLGCAAILGDLTGDGATDFVLGGNYHSDGHSWAAVYSHAGELDGDYMFPLVGTDDLHGYGERVGSLGDWDGDGLGDWVAGERDFALVFRGGTEPPEEVARYAVPQTYEFKPVGCGDVTGDGYSDLLAWWMWGTAISTMTVLPGGTSGALDDADVIASWGEGVVVGFPICPDLDADGFLEVVAPVGDGVSAWRGPLAGSVDAESAVLATSDAPDLTALATGDLDDDGTADLALGSDATVYLMMGPLF